MPAPTWSRDELERQRIKERERKMLEVHDQKMREYMASQEYAASDLRHRKELEEKRLTQLFVSSEKAFLTRYTNV